MEKDKLDKVFLECYRRLFKESKPSGDFDKMLKSGESRMPTFFMAYYLDDLRQDEIMDEIFKEFKVPKGIQKGIKNEIILGSAPSGYKETTDRERKDYSKRLKKFLNTLTK